MLVSASSGWASDFIPATVAFAKISAERTSAVIRSVSAMSYTPTAQSGAISRIFSAVWSALSKNASFRLKMAISLAPLSAHCT